MSNPKNLILDLDETLVHTYEKTDEFDDILNYSLALDSKPYIVSDTYVDGDDIIYDKMWGTTRPWMREFLISSFNNFDKVIIWSAGTDRYVRDTIEIIMSRIGKPHKIFTRKSCLNSRKNFTKPIEHLNVQSPELNLKLDNTIIIDDRNENFSHNPNNGILIPKYLPITIKKAKGRTYEEKKKNAIKSHEDLSLKKLNDWIQSSGVLTAKDVRNVDKSNIF